MIYLETMTLFLKLNTKFLKYIIYLLLYLFICNYQNSIIVSVFYLLIKFCYNTIFLFMRLLCFQIFILMSSFIFKNLDTWGSFTLEYSYSWNTLKFLINQIMKYFKMNKIHNMINGYLIL